jgi:hypothetical protein
MMSEEKIQQWINEIKDYDDEVSKEVCKSLELVLNE